MELARPYILCTLVQDLISKSALECFGINSLTVHGRGNNEIRSTYSSLNGWYLFACAYIEKEYTSRCSEETELEELKAHLKK